jgi:uncharacterized protein UPF0547
VQTWIPPWVKEIGAAIGLVLTGVGFVRLVVSGRDAFVDVLVWSGVAAAAVFTLLALVGAVRPDRDVTRKARLAFAAVAVGVPIFTAAAATHGDDSLLIALGATLYFMTGILVWAIYEERRRLHAESIKECPDCLETVKNGARVCRYCGYRWAEPLT